MITTVLFDLDDTLTDAALFGATVLARAIEEHGRSLEIAVIQQFPGVAYLPLVQQLLDVPGHEAAAIYATYVQRYGEAMAADLREHAGASDVLRALCDQGVRIGIVTNKLERLAREILAMFGWDASVEVVVGQDACEFRKPHPGVVLYALAALDGQPETTLFIGDTPSDMQCAGDAGVAMVVGFLTTTDALALTRAGATHLCSDLHEVVALVRS